MAKKPITIDILDEELSKGLPHWLDPMVRYKGKHDADRRERQIDRSNKIMAQGKKAQATKSWQRLKAKLLAKYDPSQPRDDDGKWTDTGASDEGDPTSASVLLELPNVTADELIDSTPGARKQVEEVRDRLAKGTPTIELHKKGGEWTPERQAVHRDVIDKLVTAKGVAATTPAPGEKPVLHILGGRGGSGKGWFTGPHGTVDKSKALYLNSDDVKERLPEYQGWNAPLLHEESSYVGGKMEKFARERGLNVVIDATLKSGLTTKERIDQFKAAGYRIEGHYMHASPARAAERALGRFTRGMEKNGKGRFVAPEYSLTSLTNEQSLTGTARTWIFGKSTTTIPRRRSCTVARSKKGSGAPDEGTRQMCRQPLLRQQGAGGLGVPP